MSRAAPYFAVAAVLLGLTTVSVALSERSVAHRPPRPADSAQGAGTSRRPDGPDAAAPVAAEADRGGSAAEAHGIPRPAPEPPPQPDRDTGGQARPASALGLHDGLREVDRAGDYVYASNDPYCANLPVYLSDAVQEIGIAAFDEARRQVQTYSPQEEQALGDVIASRLATDPSSPHAGRIDPPNRSADRAYVQALVDHISSVVERTGVRYVAHVVDTDDVNAFAIPGGHVFVHTRLLDDRTVVANEAQLMGVLAHEIGHNDLRHTTLAFEVVKQLGGGSDEASMAMASLLKLTTAPYSSEIEDEADRYSLSVMQALGYSGYQTEQLWRAWDRLFAATPAQPAAAGDIAGAIGAALGAELENLLQSHSSPRSRACNTRTGLREQRNPPDSIWYVGTTNLARRQDARAVMF